MKNRFLKIVKNVIISATFISCMISETVFATYDVSHDDMIQEYEIESSAETEIETESESVFESESEFKKQLESEAVAETEVDNIIESETEVVIESESEVEVVSETESETESEKANNSDINIIYASDIDTFAHELGEIIACEEDKVELFDYNACTNRILIGYNTSMDYYQYEGLDTVLDNCCGEAILQFKSTEDSDKALTAFLQDSNIVYAEYDVLEKCIDEDFSNEIDFMNDVSNWNVSMIGADSYSNYVSSRTYVPMKVAVVDSGVNTAHPYLSSRVTSGYDFVDSDSNPMDKNSHGSHVAGIIVACTKYNTNIKIMPVRVLGADGSGYSSNIATGVRYAVDHGASVINMSLGGSHASAKDSAIKYALNNECMVIVSSGNDSMYISGDVCPAHVSGAITVGAIDQYYEYASFSNYGPAVDMCAPGDSVESSVLGTGYGKKSGTSMAVPHVAAAAAMLRLVHPSYSISWIESLMKYYATDLGSSGADYYYGTGMVNLNNILSNEHNLKLYSAKKATCSTDGHKSYYKCLDCGKIFSDRYGSKPTTKSAVLLKAMGHSWGDKVLKVKASTSKAGYYLSKCTRSGCTSTKKYTINMISKISVKSKNYAYTGSAIKSPIIVVDSAGNTISSKYYTLSYSNNVKPGLATVQIVFKGKYTGKKSRTYVITPKPTSFVYIKNNKSSAKITWIRCSSSCTGYEIQYSTDVSFKSNTKTKYVGGKDTTSCTVSVNTGNRMYYRIRTYKTVNNKKYYSKWSGVYQK